MEYRDGRQYGTNAGWYTSIELDTNGYPRISYYNNGYKSLKYAYKDITGWHFLTVDRAGGGGYVYFVGTGQQRLSTYQLL